MLILLHSNVPPLNVIFFVPVAVMHLFTLIAPPFKFNVPFVKVRRQVASSELFKTFATDPVAIAKVAPGQFIIIGAIGTVRPGVSVCVPLVAANVIPVVSLEASVTLIVLLYVIDP